MLNLERDEFGAAQVKLALHHPHRRMDFRYELLDKNGNKKADLYNVISGEVQQQALATIKRTARFTLRDDGSIDYLSDRIRPIARLYVPDGRTFSSFYTFYSQQFAPLIDEAKQSKKSGWVEFPLGEFLLSSPVRYEVQNQVLRNVVAFDGLVVLTDDKFESDYIVPAGTNYVEEIIKILKSAGIKKYNVEKSDKVTTKNITFDIGSEKLYGINELARGINYESIHVDVNGYYTSAQYRSPMERASEYNYFTDSNSVIFGGYTEELDTFDIHNKWIAIVREQTLNDSEKGNVALQSVFTNDNPDSPTSTVNLGRTKVRSPIELKDVADQQTLDEYVKRVAYESSQVFGKIAFETALMPHHDYFDVFNVYFSDLEISGKYSETSWLMPLMVGGRMKHEVRRTEFII
jgi:hypothetical protein